MCLIFIHHKLLTEKYLVNMTNRPVYWALLRHRLTPFSKSFKRVYDYKLWELEISDR
jgi:hypothetical protein